MIHENSLAAWDELKPSARKKVIYEAYGSATLTDRQVCNRLGMSDMNYGRPRITEMIADGILEERQSVVDHVTNRKVRTCSIAVCHECDGKGYVSVWIGNRRKAYDSIEGAAEEAGKYELKPCPVCGQEEEEA